MTKTPHQMSPAALRDEGYLQEVNRQFFHPLGLAMWVDTMAGTMGVYDDRADLEGWVFGPGPGSSQDAATFLVEKAALIATRRQERIAARVGRFGYWVQPVTPDRAVSE